MKKRMVKNLGNTSPQFASFKIGAHSGALPFCLNHL